MVSYLTDWTAFIYQIWIISVGSCAHSLGGKLVLSYCPWATWSLVHKFKTCHRTCRSAIYEHILNLLKYNCLLTYWPKLGQQGWTMTGMNLNEHHGLEHQCSTYQVCKRWGLLGEPFKQPASGACSTTTAQGIMPERSAWIRGSLVQRSSPEPGETKEEPGQEATHRA